MSYKGTLLTTNNVKTSKGEAKGYLTYILYMSPFTQNSKGINLCPMASEGCAAACLFGSGFGGMFTAVEQGRINKTEYFLADRANFMKQLDAEITLAKIKNKDNKIITIRLNGTSDVSFEKFKIREDKNIFELHPEIQFYDYTKNYKRFERVLPANYSLTFSRSEINHERALEVLKKGFNVAVVFDKLPKKFEGYEVINGDEDDLRFNDKQGVVVGLKYKKLTSKGADNTIAFTSGFAVSVGVGEELLEIPKKVKKVSV